HPPMHRVGLVTFNEPWLVAVALHELRELLARNAREHGRARNLVAIEVQDRQHCTVTRRVQELVRVPSGSERTGLGLTVADDARGDEAGIVEHGAKRMRDRVTELAALMNRARHLGRDMAWNATRKRELAKETLQAGLVARNIGIQLAIRAFKIC